MTGKIRIIGGRWRGRKVIVPDRPGLRPSGDRVRETLFNWLQAEVYGSRCLDLFAGSGALGLEAASRGAGSVVLIERDRELASRIQSSVSDWPQTDGVRVVCADAMAWIEQCRETFDLVFIDPPFGARLQARALELLLDRGLLAEESRVYVEGPDDDSIVDPPGVRVVRDKRVGRVRMLLLEPETASGPV